MSKPLLSVYGSVVGNPALLDAASMIMSLFSCSSFSKSHPNCLASLLISRGFSSRVTKIPGWSYLAAPAYRNCMQHIVFPVPAPPETRMFVPFTNPPCRIPSSPGIPDFILSIIVCTLFTVVLGL